MLDQYKDTAEKYYSVESGSTLTDVERAARLDEAKKHLDHERRHLETIASIQAQLDEYRELGLSATKGNAQDKLSARNLLAAEKHHPTDVLEKYMRVEGIPKPSTKHTAHHIVPGLGKLKVVTNQTRVHLHIYGIRINDPANGVYLVRKDEDTPHWSMPNSRGHLKYHTHEYERWISQRLRPLRNIDTLTTHLQIIGRLLQANEPEYFSR